MSSAFVDMLSDRVSYPQVILQTIASLPVFAVAEIAAALARRFGGPKQKDGACDFDTSTSRTGKAGSLC